MKRWQRRAKGAARDSVATLPGGQGRAYTVASQPAPLWAPVPVLPLGLEWVLALSPIRDPWRALLYYFTESTTPLLGW